MSDPTVTRAPEVPPDSPTATSAGDAPATTDGVPTAPPGYELRTLIGSGGMGAVYRAYDLALARDVALKFLHARYAPDSVSAWRFTEEARITARLQHPGIPPIHQVGRTPDGRPFLAMKLIKGDTLDDRLKARATPADNRSRFVGIFEQVAQAVAFAHSRRIIHRDLKPANVMVGDFGEVQVMDWGLAKELGEAPSAEPQRTDETLSVELRAGRDGAEATQAGSLLGTPAYMPPEQAVGAIDQIDERADVFGLGAILCVILTGKPPFIADTAESTRVIAARGKLDDAFTRLDTSGAEPELISLCKRCLAPEAADRPANAGEVARAVAAFRADAERRARQAETDRATAEVKVAEERKRRRVQRVLALTVLGLIAVAGVASWWIERERSARRSEQVKYDTDQALQESQLLAQKQLRQITTERDVTAALTEVQLLREQGLKLSDDPERWGLTLVAARSALKRAEGVLASGESTDELSARVVATTAELDRDDRDRALLAELDRIEEENEIRMIIPISFTDATSRKYAAAFRTAGIDLTEAPTKDAVAWFKAHRFRDRLALAVRNWSQSLPPGERDTGIVVIDSPHLNTLAGLVGEMGVTTLRYRPNLGARLNKVPNEVTTDPFTRAWWTAVTRNDKATLKNLLTHPELRRMSSRELASLADGLSFVDEPQILQNFMELAYDRLPGAFWVHLRYAFVVEIAKGTDDPNNAGGNQEMLRHLTAAVAARPKSAIARSALGMQLMELGQDAAGRRMLRSASEMDPTSPWPHLFLGMHALEKDKWDEAIPALKSAVRADPDTGYFMIYSVVLMVATYNPTPDTDPNATDPYLSRLIEETAAIHPNHPGAHNILGELHLKKGNARAALAAFHKANQLASAAYLGKQLLTDQLSELERKARWEGKIDDVLAGKITPENSTEVSEIAGYCALFDKKYALAADFATAALKTDPGLIKHWGKVNQFAGWAIQAAAGNGSDGANLTAKERTEYRQKARTWLREGFQHVHEELRESTGSILHRQHDLRPVRDLKELAKLPPDERAEWEKFWATIPNSIAPTVPVAPPPREVKR